MRKRSVPAAFENDSQSDTDSEESDIPKKVPKQLKLPVNNVDQSNRLDQGDIADSINEGEPNQDYMNLEFTKSSGRQTSATTLLLEDSIQVEENSLERSLFDTNSQSIGISIMKRMGFREGDSLGQSSKFKTNNNFPISLKVKTDRSGIGGGSQLESEPNSKPVRIDIPAYRNRLISSSSESKTIYLTQKLQKTFFHHSGDYDKFLDGPNNFVLSEVNILWREYALQVLKREKRKNVSKRTLLFDSTCQDDPQSDKTLNTEDVDFSDWEPLEDTNKLQALLGYGRETFNYCIFCGCFYEGQADLQDHCPGPSESDHC